jgi:YYY domain-containing protein
MAGLNLRWRSGASAKAADSSPVAGSRVSSASLAIWLVVIAITLLAFTARAYNVHWDENTHAHPDERHMTVVTLGLSFPDSIGEYFDTGKSPLNPYNLENSPSFVYGTFPVFLTKAAAELTGHNHYDDLVIVSRELTALFSAATVLFAFLAGRRLYGAAAGLIAAVLISASPLAIQHAHFFVVDTYLAFFMTAAFYFAVRVMHEGRMSDYALTGLMLGLGLACKVTGVLFVPVIFAAAVVRLWPMLRDRIQWQDGMSKPLLGVALALIVAFIAFRVAQPYAFDGVVSLNQQWVDDYKEQNELLSGNAAFPPSVQWIDRTSYLYPLHDMVEWGMGPAFGIAAWLAFAYAGYRLLRRHEVAHLLPLVFVLAYFGFMGRQFSLYMRYFLPLYPVLAVMAGYGLVELYRGGVWLARRYQRPWLEYGGVGVTAVVLIGSAIAGLAYTGIYSRDFTRADATRWLYVNAPNGAVIAGESWDETLPMGIQNPPNASKRFDVFGLNLYDADSPQKLEQLIDDLDRADYVTVSSNRLMNSLPRNTNNYPLSSKYHEMLLDGDLGYELVAEFTSSPQLLGIEAPDSGVQESWSSYDHPRVLIFQKGPNYSRQHLEDVFGHGPYATTTVSPKGAEGPALLLSSSDLQTQQQGGTWTDVFSTDGLPGHYPTLLWLIVLEATAFAVTPISLVLFKRLPDRGYLLSKPLGVLLLSYLTWLIVSLKIVHFEQATVLAMLLVLAAIGSTFAIRWWDEIAGFVRERWRMVLFCEALFFAAFFLFWFFRIENPDLWHAFRGGEKPMDLAYFTAVTRSTTLPPYDPWFAGGYINYYYLGQFFTATLTKLTAIMPEMAYNLAVPTYFALTATGAFSVVYNLAEASRRLLGSHHAGAGAPSVRPEPVEGRGAMASRTPEGREDRPAALRTVGTITCVRSIPPWSAYAAGVLGVFLVAIAGNLDGVGQMVERLSDVSSFGLHTGLPVVDSVANSAGGLWQVVFHGAALRDFDYWRSSRMLPPTISITEFPFFSFLFADLHAHMMAIAFQILTIGLCLTLVLRARGELDHWRDAGLVVLLGLIVGSLRWLNSWDYPPFLMLAVAAVLISERYLEGGVWATLQRAVLKCIVLVGLSFLFYEPFLANYRAPISGITSSPEQTPIHQYLAHFGVFAAVIAVGLAVWAYRALRAVRVGQFSGARTYEKRLNRQTVAAMLFGGALAIAFISFALATSGQPLVATLLPVFVVVVCLAVREIVQQRPDGGIRLFVLTLIGLGLGLSMGVDIVILQGDIVRMNTVFKFYLHVWIVFALASAFLAWQLIFVYWRPLFLRERSTAVRVPRVAARAAMAGLALLLFGAALYPIFATPVRLDDRFEGSNSTGLDGEAYAQNAVYQDEHGPIQLEKDFEGIEWMRENVEGSPTIVEGRAELYRWGGRFSIYTGLPTVVGWDWHQRQQRGDLAYMVQQRVAQLDNFYNTSDVSIALRFLQEYDVRYVIVGQLEHYYYSPSGIAKFATGLNGTLTPVFQNDQLTIYQVDPDRLATAVAQ